MKHFDRIGKFSISMILIENNPDFVREIFSRLKAIVLRAETLWYNKEIEYFAISERFDVREEGMVVPTYKLEVTNTNDGHVSSIRVIRQGV